jgi:uncharacterized protein YdcH (DUF465 family)
MLDRDQIALFAKAHTGWASKHIQGASMNLVEHHPLILEFPEFREKIHELKMSDKHFSNLFESYEEVDKAVVRMENGNEPNTDDYLEEQKKARLHLKDQLYAILSSPNTKQH